MARNCAVSSFRNGRSAREAQIQLQHPLFAGNRLKCAEYRVRPAAHFPVGHDELYGRREIFPGNVWKARTDFLVRRETQAIACHALRILDPSLAKSAVAIENNERPV